MGIRERRGREEQARLTAILGAAESVFARKGFYEARMDDIAEKAELAKGTLYYYFKSKDEIFVHLLERESEKVYEELKARIPGEASFREILDVVLKFSVDYLESNRVYLRMFLPCMFGMVQFGNAGDLERSRRTYDRHADFVREALGRAIARERLPISLDELARFLKTFQLGLGLRIVEGAGAEARRTADFFMDLIKKTLEKHA
jgi:AcrR family transcriptional regulator